MISFIGGPGWLNELGSWSVKEIRKLKSQDSRISECLRFTGPTKKSENCSAILDNYKIENPREVREITSEWLLITGSLTILCVTPTPYQLRPITFFTHDIVYQQYEKYILRDKGFKDKTCIIFEIYL